MLQLGSFSDGQCDACGKQFSRGMGVREQNGILLTALCRWCIALVMDDVTGFKVSDQLLDWELKRNSRRITKWRGWK